MCLLVLLKRNFCYDARSHERKKMSHTFSAFLTLRNGNLEQRDCKMISYSVIFFIIIHANQPVRSEVRGVRYALFIVILEPRICIFLDSNISECPEITSSE